MIEVGFLDRWGDDVGKSGTATGFRLELGPERAYLALECWWHGDGLLGVMLSAANEPWHWLGALDAQLSALGFTVVLGVRSRRPEEE